MAVSATLATAQIQTTIETQASVSNNKTPLWLNANKYGLSSLNSANGYLRGSIGKTMTSRTDDKLFDYGFCADLVAPVGYVSQSDFGRHTSHLIVQQLYADLRYQNLVLTIGAKQQPMELHDNRLSSGAQTIGINARPIPQVRLGLNEWCVIPGLNRWVQVNAHASYGIMTDGDWQEEISEGSRFIRNSQTRYHEKAGYLRIGKTERFPLTMTIGLQMAAQFGGYLYNWGGTDQNDYQDYGKLKLKSDLKSYWNAFMPGGGDTAEKQFQNAEGNQLGSWILRFDWVKPDYTIGLYGDHFFEDHSSMFFLDYDGYGTGDEWYVKKDFRYFLYRLEDLQLGIDLKLNNCKYLKRALVEFINSKYQSGPIYHDHNQSNPDHLGGIDDYYNHSTLPGWQHHGQVIGNPLYRSPLYNTNGYIGSNDNRFTAWHLGAEGNITDCLSYRMLCTYRQGFGTYRMPLENISRGAHLMGELTYTVRPFAVIFAVGSDSGHSFGNNFGSQLTLRYKL